MNALFTKLIKKVIKSDALHAKWINTLSYLENCGARKIAACQHPTLVKEEMLKHAAEEFRHSHYLKSQIKKLGNAHLPDYSLKYMLGGITSLHYLHSLDLFTVRFLLHSAKVSKFDLAGIVYPLVTYAIELRAQKLYPIYHKILRWQQSEVRVKSIILEEEKHLEEMDASLSRIKNGHAYAKEVCRQEKKLFDKWLYAVEHELFPR